MSFFAKLRRRFLSRPERTCVLAALLLAAPAVAASSARWEERAQLPLPRTEVAAAAAGGKVVVVGGFLADGSTSPRADAYDPGTDAWQRLPDLPVAVNHAAAAAYQDRVYVLGGYTEERGPTRNAWMLDRRRWRALPPMPFERGAAAAAVSGTKLYVVGGVGPAGLARNALVLDLRRNRWSTIRGPRPREHLAAAALWGRVYVLGGRLAGIDTNLALVQSYSPRTRRWRGEPALPEARGGTGAAAVTGEIFSVGGEEPRGTIGTVYAFSPRTRRWRRVQDLPTPRHGLGVAALGGRLYVVAGGPKPGLFVSGANEVLVPVAR
jgi:N-acetylneuraminic acid mutarotase